MAADHPFYGRLINRYLDAILNSGLLLDEDLEVLATAFQPKKPPKEAFYTPYVKVLPVALVSCIVWRRYNAPLPAFLIAAALGCFEVRKMSKRRAQSDVLNEVKENLVRKRRQSVEIARYMKTRAELGVRHKDREGSFVKELVRIETRLFECYMNTLSHLSTFYPQLQEDYDCLNQIADMFEGDDCASRLLDLHVLFTSKFLSYLGLVLCGGGLSARNLEDILDVRLRELLACLKWSCEAVSEQFDDLRYSARKLDEIKTRPERQGVSGRLHGTLASAVNNLSVIMEKSRELLGKMETGRPDAREIEAAIVDLRDHTFATYETLDVLCRLYGVLSNAKPKAQPAQSIRPKINPEEHDDLERVNYDDVLEPHEEKYELFIGENDKIPQVPVTRYEDQSSQYLNLMLRELKQSLKQHERFISAKNRRESDSESDEEVKTTKQELPKFDLKVLESPVNEEETKVTSSESVPSPLPFPVTSTQPPPPPPLPPPVTPGFNLNNLQQETGFANSRSMLQNIKALSNQINANEEVFGDNFEDSDSLDN